MTRFRFLTANLLRDRVDSGDLASVLDRHRPDVVAIQELGPEAAGLIADRYSNHELHPATEYKGRGIASRFDAEFGPLELPWRAGDQARVDTGGGIIHVASVHLLNPVDFPWWVTASRRRRQLDALIAWSEAIGDRPALIAGDMNASPMWPAYRRLASRWDDLVAEWARSTGTRPEPTWGWRPGWRRLLRIDHVFGTAIRAVEATVVPIRGSDHAALILDLELP